MREFFRGWRRKMGTATLLMACLFMAAWVRSHSFVDVANVPNGRPTSLVIRSGRGELVLAIINEEIEDGWKTLSLWASVPAYDVAGWGSVMMGGTSRDGIEEWATIKLCWVLPYWSIILSLTLISIYLLLSKPRSKSKQPVPHA